MEHIKKTLLRITAYVLVIALLAGLVPPATAATGGTEDYTSTLDPTELAVEGSNAFGSMLAETLNDSLEEESEGDSTYNVTALVVEGNTATVTLDTLEEAELVVAVYTEDGTQMLQSVKTTVEAYATEATVTFAEELPQYFLVSAYLLDTFDLSPLCTPYENPRYTQDMQELLASDIHDYDPELVLNLDESEDNNFAVYEETIKIIPHQEGVNLVATADYENDVYVIENADDYFTTLAAGDIVAYSYGDDELLIAKVETLTVEVLALEGVTVTIQGAELDLDEVFSHVKIIGDMGSEGAQVDPSAADEGITYLGKKSNGTNHAPGDIVPQISVEESVSYSDTFGVEYKPNENFMLNGELSLTVEGDVEVCITTKRQFVEATLGLEMDFTVSVTVTMKKTMKKDLGKIVIPIVTGLSVTFIPKLVFEASATVSGSFGIDAQLGFRFEHKSKKKPTFKNLCRKPKGTITVQFEGSIFFGVELEPAFTIGGGKLAKVGVTGSAGLEFDATLVEGVFLDGLVHDCVGCVSGKAYAKLEAGVELSFLKRPKLTFSRTFAATRCRLKKLDFYMCASHGEMGWGECPYLLHEITVTVEDENGDPVVGASVYGGDDVEKSNKNGVAVLRVPDGKHEVQAIQGDLIGKKKITAGKKDKLTITVKPFDTGDDDGPLDGNDDSDFLDYGTIVDCGMCGEEMEWVFYDSGVLVIVGEGAMFDFEAGMNIPWEDYREQITRLVVKEGVTSLGDYAFMDCSYMTSAELPNGLERIGRYTFSACKKLAMDHFPETLIRIEEFAFLSCYKLTSLEFPESLTYLGREAFEACYGLSSVVLPNGITEIPVGVFASCDNLRSVTIPDNIEEIGDWAFEDCTSLRSIEIPDSVTLIGIRAFRESGLESITIPHSVTCVEYEAFAFTNLGRVDIPATLTELARGAFNGCGALRGIYVDKFNPNYSNDAWGVLFNKDKTILQQAPGQIGRDNIDRTYTVPSTVVRIGGDAFYECNWMDNVIIPASVRRIETNAFYCCHDLNSIKFGGDAPYLEARALKDRKEFKPDICYAYYPAGNETWTEDAMNNPDKDLIWRSYDPGVETLVASGTCGDNLTWKLNDMGRLTISGTGEMPGYAEVSAAWLPYRYYVQSAVIEEGVTSIGEYAFWDHSAMTSVSIPDSVTTIGPNAFRDCTALADVPIPDSVTTIGTEAFWNTGLKTVEISANVTQIGDYAFGEGRSMTGIHVATDNPNYSSDASGVLFDKAQTILLQAPCAITGAYTVPDTVTEIGNQAFMWCSGLTEITIPVSVIGIGYGAFNGCPGLADVWYGGTEEQWNAITFGEYNEGLSEAVIHFSDGQTIAPVRGSLTSVGQRPGAMAPDAVYPGDYGKEETEEGTFKTADFDGLVPGGEYVLLSLLSMDADDPLAAENLLYIDHATATEEGTASFTYIPRIWLEGCYVVLCGPSHKDLNDAEITFPLMGSDGELQAVDPTVVYEGETLTEGRDYVLLGTVSFSECGTYTCYVRGVRNYTGLVQCTYTVADHVHVFENYVSDGNATCTADGTKTAVCLYCDATDTLPDEGSMVDHSWDEGVVTKEPTEYATGTILYTCVGCGLTRTETLPRLAHVHKLVVEWVEEPTCTDVGYTLYYCTECMEYIYDDFVDKVPHEWDEGTVIVAPTEESEGQIRYDCINCWETRTETLPRLDHTHRYEAAEVVEPTCMEDGYTVYRCAGCGDTYHDDFTPRYYHSWDEGVVTLEPTEEYEGEMLYTCIRCGATETDAIPRIHDHENIVLEVIEPTCTESGYTVYECTYCGVIYEDSFVDPLGHAWDEGVVIQEPTLEQEGEKLYTCTRCAETWTEYLPQLHEHEFYYYDTVEPTCYSEGYTIYKCCWCDALSYEDHVPMLEHTWDEGVVTLEPTTEHEGEMLYTCTVCSATKTEPIPKLHSHSFKVIRVVAPTCTEEGYSIYMCADCGEVRFDDYVEASGHSFSEWVTVREPAAGEAGLEERTCAACGLREERTIPALDNPFTDVPAGSFYEESVLWAVENGITNGLTADSFGPNATCNRAQVVTFLWRAAGCPEPESDSHDFVDVQAGSFYEKAVLWAVENGITTGSDATHFNPGGDCNRAQVVTFMYRTAGSPAVSVAGMPFADVPAGAWYEAPVAWAVENGITNGLDAAHFGPNVICNRAQVVTFLYRAFAE